MRKESLKIARAFAEGKRAAAARTMTDGNAIWLHGNRIAQREDDGAIWVTLAGWGSVTTRERLNTLCRVLEVDHGFCQRNHVQYWMTDAAQFEIDPHDRVEIVKGATA